MKINKETSEEPAAEPEKEKESEETPSVDIMAQQLKFVACLKILMEELSTLATGFEVDGEFVMLIFLSSFECFHITDGVFILKYLLNAQYICFVIATN